MSELSDRLREKAALLNGQLRKTTGGILAEAATSLDSKDARIAELEKALEEYRARALQRAKAIKALKDHADG